MVAKPILFSAEMVQAILAGSKTQTRRVVKVGNHAVIRGGTFPGALDGPKYGAELDNHSVIVAPYQKGDILYVRETWSFLPCATCGQRNCLLKPTRMETADGENDGKRYRIGGRSGNTIILRHAYSLIVSPEQEKLLKAVQRYVDRCTLKRKDLPLTENSGFSDDDLNGLYHLFQDKLDAKPYAGLFGMLPTHMKNNEETFKLLEPTNKARVILQILKAFIPNPECPNLSILCGVSLCGRIQINKQIKPEDHFAVIDHSVSGLRERKTLF